MATRRIGAKINGETLVCRTLWIKQWQNETQAKPLALGFYTGVPDNDLNVD